MLQQASTGNDFAFKQRKMIVLQFLCKVGKNMYTILIVFLGIQLEGSDETRKI